MSQSTAHCPFLNRSDARCNQCFNLKGLGHAYAFCFGDYQACPNYQKLLGERQQHRQHVQLTIHAGIAQRRAVA